MANDIRRAPRRALKMWAEYYGINVRWWNWNSTIRRRIIDTIQHRKH